MNFLFSLLILTFSFSGLNSNSTDNVNPDCNIESVLDLNSSEDVACKQFTLHFRSDCSGPYRTITLDPCFWPQDVALDFLTSWIEKWNNNCECCHAYYSVSLHHCDC